MASKDVTSEIPAEMVTLSKSDLLAMIEDAVSERVSRIDVPRQAGNSDVHDLAEAIATSTAEIANQGVGKKIATDPKIVKSRREANKQMRLALADALGQGESLTYQIINVCFLGGTMVWPKWADPRGPEQNTVIEWQGVPNLAMRPVSDAAKRVFDLFQRSIGNADTTAESPYPATSGQKTNIKFLAGGPRGQQDVVDLGKAHAQEGGLKIVAGQPAAHTDNRLLNVLERVNLS